MPNRFADDLKALTPADLARLSHEDLLATACELLALTRAQNARLSEDSRTSSRPPSSDDPYRREERRQKGEPGGSADETAASPDNDAGEPKGPAEPTGARDDVAYPIEVGVEGKAAFSIGLVGDDWLRSALMEKGSQVIGVVAFVGDDVFTGLSRGEQRRSALDVGDVSAGQEEGARPAFVVNNGVDFRRAAAARAADGFVFRSPFLAPLAERCAFTAEQSINVSAGGSAQ